MTLLDLLAYGFIGLMALSFIAFLVVFSMKRRAPTIVLGAIIVAGFSFLAIMSLSGGNTRPGFSWILAAALFAAMTVAGALRRRDA